MIHAYVILLLIIIAICFIYSVYKHNTDDIYEYKHSTDDIYELNSKFKV